MQLCAAVCDTREIVGTPDERENRAGETEGPQSLKEKEGFVGACAYPKCPCRVCGEKPKRLERAIPLSFPRQPENAEREGEREIVSALFNLS